MEGENMVYAGNYDGNYLNTAFKAWVLKSNKPSKSANIIIKLNILKAESIQVWEKSLDEINAKTNQTERNY
ncbi:MAG: hypothetical protein EOO43_22565 [Flavobacterium sp.]|nr:MAG: hypothetical protein EOO43_22565 [Flavobacterium sp.]